MRPGAGIGRGPAGRPRVTPGLLRAIADQYGLQAEGALELHGSSNLNLLMVQGPDRYVARVYRQWVTASRLGDIQRVRQILASGGVPCAQPIHALDGQPWIIAGDHLIEVEPYSEHDAKMDTWARLEAGLPLLGRIHSLLQPLLVSEDGRNPPAANYIAPADLVPGVQAGIRRMREWTASPAELALAAQSEDLAQQVERAERSWRDWPRQLVHGDYWDNNVLFRGGRVVLVADLDFMGVRARLDDLALTLYYTNSTFREDAVSSTRRRRLRALVDAYNRGLNEPLTPAERAALPLAIARTALGFIAMMAEADSIATARRLAAEMTPDIAWAQAIVRELDSWQAAFA
jgi:Ser/Thr protein kinase RdoA (MazF antagonist)